MTFERRILTRYDASTAGFDRGTRRVEQQLARLQRTTDSRLASIDRRFERAGRAALRLGTAIGAIGGGLAVNAVRNYAEAWRSAERSLTAAGFAVDGNREKLAQLAIRVRGDLASTSGAVARFARVTGDDLETSIRRVETLRKLLSVGGASTAEAASATLQLTQGLRSGQLGGEELRAIREAAPVEFLDALAQRAGGTRAELKQLGADGKLTAEVITGALDDLAAQADRDFGKLAITGSEAFEVLNTGFAAFFGNLDQELGATAGLNQFLASTGELLTDNADAARTFAQALEVVAVAGASVVGGRLAGGLTRNLAASKAVRLEVLRLSQDEAKAAQVALVAARERAAARAAAVAGAKNQASALKSVAAANKALTAAEIRATTATQALAAAQAQLSVATRLSARAMGILRGALAFFGGVPGLIVAAATAAVLFKDELFGAAEAAVSTEEAIERLEGKIADADAQMRRLSDTNRALETDTERLEAANDRLSAAIERGESAAISAASAEVQAISRRIAANEALRQKYVEVLAAQRVAIQAELQVARRSFNNEFGQRFEDAADTGAVTAAAIGANDPDPDRARDAIRRLSAEKVRAEERQGEAIEKRRQAAIAATREGAATEEQLKFLQADAELATRTQQVEDLGAAIAEIQAGGVVQSVGVGGGGGAGGGAGGGGGKKGKETPDILADQQARNQALLEELRIDQQLVAMREQLVAAGVSAADADRQIEQAKNRLTAVLERNRIEQELLTRAQEEGISVTPQLRAQVAALADGYLELTLAKQQAAEQDRRLQDEAQALADRQEEVGRAVEDLGDRFAGIVRDAESLEDALKKVGIELANLVAQAIAGKGPLADLFGGGGGFGGFFSSLFGGGGGGGLNLDNSFRNALGQDVRFLHSGGVVGRDGRPGRVPAALFANAPRYHDGGIAGLAPNEVPAILQRGEVVVPKDIGMGRAAGPIDASMTVEINNPGASADDILRALEPRLAAHQRETIAKVRTNATRNPNFIPGT